MNPGNRRYRCRSGEIEVAVDSAEQWHALAVCIGRPELAYAGAWDVVHTAPADGATAAVVQEMLSEDDASVWARRFEANGVPFLVIQPDATSH